MNAVSDLPMYVSLAVYACALIAGVFLYLSASCNKLSLAVWLTLFGVCLGIAFLIPKSIEMPGAMLFAFAPIVLVLVAILAGKWPFIADNFNDSYAHYFHLWRLPASFVPLWLYQAGIVPINMTFEGLNLDIVAGLTAPVLSSLAFGQQMLGRTVVLVWNLLAALLLLSSSWLVYAEMLANTRFFDLFTSFPFAILLFALVPMSLCLHLLAVWRIWKGKMSLTD